MPEVVIEWEDFDRLHKKVRKVVENHNEAHAPLICTDGNTIKMVIKVGKKTIIGDDGQTEVLCKHGVGHSKNAHTCDYCCKQDKNENRRNRKKVYNSTRKKGSS